MQVQVGEILEGKVTGITGFGAFVEIGEGVTGMVHISEVSNKYITDIKEVLKHLSNEYREVINYYYIQEKKISEISKILKVPEGTVKSRLSRARKIMAEMLKYDVEEV